jgi:cyclic-di-GMP-binding protein
MLATARPNKLRQGQLRQIFDALEIWSQWITLAAPDRKALFVVDLGSLGPPRHRALGYQPGDRVRGIRTGALVRGLDAHLKNKSTELPVPDYLDSDLVEQLVQAWGEMKRRSFQRRRASGTLKACIGLRTIHFHVSGAVEFADQLGSTAAMLRRELNPFLDSAAGPSQFQRDSRNGPDPWNCALDAGSAPIPENPNIEDPERLLLRGRNTPTAEAPAERYPCFDTVIEDTSPAGYCLRWPHPFPAQLLAGALVAFREASDSRWTIAICRWIRHDGDKSRTGIELLAPHAVPLAVCRIDKRGGTQHSMRALLLPPLGTVRQDAMLVLPQLPFAEQQKVLIQRQSAQATAQLLKCVRRTENFTQFTFRVSGGYLESALPGMNMDVLWQSMGSDVIRASK